MHMKAQGLNPEENLMSIRLAAVNDIDILCGHDLHISKTELKNLVELNRIYIAEENGEFIGWLRYNLFWDNTPFMNMLYVFEEYRGNGIGRQLVEHWEKQMTLLGYDTVMTSTASDEYAQHFYMKLGYKVIGGFFPKGDPYEVILSKGL